MPAKIAWTDAQDARLRRLRAEGATWDVIAAALDLARFTVIERGRRIGAQRPPVLPRLVVEDPAREPLPPGHPRTWEPLVAGTALEGSRYPFPVFRR